MCYGTDARIVLELARDDRELMERITPAHPHILAQVAFGYRHELLYTANAFLAHFGKGGLALDPGARARIETVIERQVATFS